MELDVGCLIYYNNGKMEIWKIPLFTSSVKPIRVTERKKPNLWQKIRVALSGNEDEEEFDDIDDESEIEIDESEEYPEEWGLE